MLITRAEVDGRIVDVAVDGGVVRAVGPDLPTADALVVDAAGGALIPGLHDHHLHLLAMAAARDSVRLDAAMGPADLDQVVAAAHRRLPPRAWLRGVGLDDRHGPVDRTRLDRLAPGRPVRVQHRSGAAWVLSSAALALVGRADSPDGWLHRVDDLVGWPREAPDLGPVADRLAHLGVTGVTDATPFSDPSTADLLAAARRSGDLPQRVVITGGPHRAGDPAPAGLERGPVKVVVADDALPGIEDLVGAFRAARGAGRTVAVHCVTRIGLVLALAAWQEVGSVPGDRIEHGSVIPVELVSRVADLDLRVVTQPGFIAERGDRYLAEVECDDRPHLYRCGSLLEAGIAVAGSTDAPFGPEDPWVAIATAVTRRTATGAAVGAGEAIEPHRALDLFLGAADDPGGPPRRVVPGVAADLCLLDRPLPAALADPSAAHVRSTWIAGASVVEDQRRMHSR